MQTLTRKPVFACGFAGAPAGRSDPRSKKGVHGGNVAPP
jgi:hypothetical protein